MVSHEFKQILVRRTHFKLLYTKLDFDKQKYVWSEEKNNTMNDLDNIYVSCILLHSLREFKLIIVKVKKLLCFFFLAGFWNLLYGNIKKLD